MNNRRIASGLELPSTNIRHLSLSAVYLYIFSFKYIFALFLKKTALCSNLQKWIIGVYYVTIISHIYLIACFTRLMIYSKYLVSEILSS